MAAKGQNDRLRQNKADDRRREEQDELQKQLVEAQIGKYNLSATPKAQKIGRDQYGMWNPETNQFDPIASQQGMDGPTLQLSESENRLESLISGNRKEFEGSPAIKDFKAIKSKADTFDRSTQALLDKFDKGDAANMAEQLDMIVSWYKMKDPTSTVTGGEVSSAADPGLADKANSLLNRIRSGGALTRQQVESFRSSGLASASSLFDSASSRAQDYMANIVSPNPYFEGRAGEVVMPQYQQQPNWFIPGEQRFQQGPFPQEQPVAPPAPQNQQQDIMNFFTPQPTR